MTVREQRSDLEEAVETMRRSADSAAEIKFTLRAHVQQSVRRSAARPRTKVDIVLSLPIQRQQIEDETKSNGAEVERGTKANERIKRAGSQMD
jgi:predicted nucleotidyltransferase